MHTIYNVESVVNISFSGKKFLAGDQGEIEVKTEIEKKSIEKLFDENKLINLDEDKIEADQDEQLDGEQTEDTESNDGDNDDQSDNSDSNEADQAEKYNQESESQEADEEADEADEQEEVVIDSLKELEQVNEQPATKKRGRPTKGGK